MTNEVDERTRDEVQPRPLWRNGNFRLLWGGQAISVLGTQVSTLALPLLHCLQVKVSIQMSRTRIFAIQGGPEGVLLPVQRMRGGPLVPGVDAAPRSCRAITARRQKLPLKSGENALDNDQKSLTCRKCPYSF